MCRNAVVIIAAFFVCLFAFACGGDAKLGESCDESGKTDGQCESGGVCGKPNDTSGLQCLKICIQQTDCPADQDCNGVDGTTVKGCRSKSSTSGTGGKK